MAPLCRWGPAERDAIPRPQYRAALMASSMPVSDRAGGWPLARCERVAPLDPSLLDEDEAPWPAEVAEPFTPSEAFDVLYEERRDAQEETYMRTVLTTLAKAQACPQCRCTNLKALGEYRKCPLCHWKGKVVQPGESEVSA